jgi:hypothetical protein
LAFSMDPQELRTSSKVWQCLLPHYNSFYNESPSWSILLIASQLRRIEEAETTCVNFGRWHFGTRSYTIMCALRD